jgi:hypothetical protein
MVIRNNTTIIRAISILMCLGGSLAITTGAIAEERKFKSPFPEDWSLSVSGYTRVYAGMLLEDQQETKADDQFDLNMLRASVYFDFDATTGPLNWKLVTRFDKEHQTNYSENLEALTLAQSPGGSATRNHYLDQYQTDNLNEFFREYYVDFSPIDRINMRIGRQQLVWGQSDFFQAMDLIHGFDFRWRLFFENNEDWRKPLFLINADIDIPELGGSLNVFVRPGLDQEEDIGNYFNIEGGRWIPTPYRGVDFTAFTNYNADDNEEGDQNDPTYGARWNSNVGSWGYSLAYLKVFNPSPIMNPAVNSVVPGLFGVGAMNSHGQLAENQVLGDWTFPLINVFGITTNGYIAGIDSTFSAEVTFTPNKPYNYGALGSSLPGWEGVREKDVISVMLRLDKELKLMKYLHTHRPSLSSIQLFDTWILDYENDDEIVEFGSFGSKKKEHTVYLTMFTLMNFKRDTINPSFVIGTDLSNGGGFAIPAVEFVFGDKWRVKAEANLWWHTGDKKEVTGRAVPGGTAHANPLGVTETSAALFDWFGDDNQLVLKITRQF